MKITKTQTNNPVDHDTFIHQPDASKTRVANIPGKRLPFPDQIGNYQRNIGTPTDAYQDSKVYIVGAVLQVWPVLITASEMAKYPLKTLPF
ncbi:hypothetical protein [Psychrobacter sp. WY6]|uniref:hypothetical protein n=1 Tax=Psychrobacter sp. WY6 TaxID=2708350 RepID=UPI0020230C90|nr:hypothetical protein [Psychrobacter sp. WY6]